MTADDLLAKIKLRAGLPTFQNTWTDASILDAINEEQRVWLAPKLAETKQEFMVDFSDQTILSGVTAYQLPERAMGGIIRKATYVDPNGIEFQPPLKLITIEDVGIYYSGLSDPPTIFWFQDMTVYIAPTPSSSPQGSLRLYYFRRPSDLVATSLDGAAQTGVNTILTATYSAGSGLTTVTTTANHNLTTGKKIDFQAANGSNRLLGKDIVVTVTGATTFTIVGDYSSIVAAGDYQTLAKAAYQPLMPSEWHSVLELRTAARVMAALADYDGANEAKGEAESLRSTLFGLTMPRTKGNTYRFSAWKR